MKVIFLVLVLFSLFVSGLYAQEGSSETVLDSENEEAPANLLDLALGDTGVDIIWDGYWKIGIAYGLGIDVEGGEVTVPSIFPGLQNGFQFLQQPDVFLSIWLLDRFYVEANFVEGFDKNSYAAGYEGPAGSFVRRVRVGSSKIGTSEYRGLAVPLPQYNTPGALALFETPVSSHEIMVRFDPTELQKKVFLGEYLVDTQTMALSSYQRGQFFILPDTGLTQVTVYQKKSSGSYTASDGYKYEKLQSGDFSYDGELGLLTLEEPSETDLVVYYIGDTGDVGSQSIDFIPTPDAYNRPNPEASPLPFSWDDTDPYDSITTGNPSLRTFQETSSVLLDGHTALKVFRPGYFSPFERLSFYTTSQTLPAERWRLHLLLKDKGDPYKTENLPLDFEVDQSNGIIELYSSDSTIRSLTSRYPLAELYPEVYGPGAVSDDDLVPMNLSLSVKKGGEGFFLGSDIAPGSVEVRVNGVIDTTVEFDSEQGTLNFRRYIFPDDYIEVSFRSESANMESGDFLIVQGNRFRFSDRWSGELAGSFRWNLDNDKINYEPGSHPGELALMTGASYNGKFLDLDLFSSLDITAQDTTGYLSLDSMEGGGRSLSVYNELLDPGLQTLSPLYNVSGNAVPFIYRDYTETSAGNIVSLYSYLWPNASDDPEREGPSVSARTSDDPFTGNIVSLRYQLDSNEYSTGDLLISEDGFEDLSSASGLDFYVRKENSTGSVRLALLLGENGEASDLDDSGSIDSSDSSMILYKEVDTLPLTDGGWSYYQWEFSTLERQLLSRFRSLKFLVEETAGSSASGTLLLGGLKFTGPVFYAEVRDALNQPVFHDDIYVREITDWNLLSEFPDIEPFYSDSDEPVTAQIRWDNIGPTETVAARRYITPFLLTDYGSLYMYVYHDTVGGNYSLRFTDNNDLGLEVNYTPETSGWQKLEIDLQGASAELSGNSTDPEVLIDGNAGEINRMDVRIQDLEQGIFRADELHARDPLSSIGNVSTLSADFSKPGPLLSSPGGFVFAADPEIHTDLRFSGGQVISSSAEPDAAFQLLADGGVELIKTRIEADFQGTWDEGKSEYSGGHFVKFPSNWEWGYISDSYRRYYRISDPSMNRASTLSFSVPDTGSLEVSAGATSSGEELRQYWKGSTTWVAGEAFNISAGTLFEAITDEDLSSSGNYFSDWAGDFTLLAFRDSDNQRRTNSNSIQIHGSVPFVSMDLSQSLGYSTRIQPSALQTSNWKSRIDFPLDLGLWTVTPYYSRSLSQSVSAETTDRFPEDFNRYGTLFTTQFPLITYIPFSDLFNPEEFNRFEESTSDIPQSTYKPQGGIIVKRENRSHWSDLLLPSQAELLVSRTYTKANTSMYYDTAWEFSLSQSASNMFGNFGLYPLFSFYNSDQINNTFRFTLASRNEALPEADNFNWNLYFTARGNRDNSFSLDNGLGFSWGDENLVTEQLRAVVTWQTTPKKRLKVPFTQWILNSSNYFKHQEKATFTIEAPFAQSDTTLGYTLILTHDTRFVVEGLGSLGGWFSFALGKEEDINRVGFEAGLELIINF